MQKRTRLYINRYVIYILALNVLQFILGKIQYYIYNPNSTRMNQNMIDIAWVFSWSYLIANIVMAILIFSDMKRLQKINWWILVITLVNKEFGAIVSLLHYFKNEEND